MATEIESLQISINAKAKSANQAIDSLVGRLDLLSKSLGKINRGSSNLTQFSNNIGKLASQSQKMGNASKNLSNGLDKTNLSIKKTTKNTFSLAATFGKFYASYFLVIRGMKSLWKSIESTADYFEAYNYFNVAMGKIGKDWSHQWEQYAKDIGVNSAKEYAESFRNRLSDSLKNLSGVTLEIDAGGKTGLLTESGMKNLGLNIREITQYASQLASVTNSVGQTGEVSLATASAFTKLGADMSSLFNMDYSQVMNNLNSALIGQSRSVYRYGIDITNATLQTLAYELGVEKAVSEMTQAEKMQLRLIAILEQSKVSWGDLANRRNKVDYITYLPSVA